MKRITKIQIIFILICIFLPVARSVNLGSFTRKESATVEPGDSITFEVLFWNLGDESYYLKISENNIPDEWDVLIEPNNFLLHKIEAAEPPFDGGKYINLPRIGVIKPSIVTIRIDVSRNRKITYWMKRSYHQKI